MNSKFTAKNYNIDKTPKLIQLFGDKNKPESAQHIIEFPGGAIEVTRCTNGEYWVHILVNANKQVFDDSSAYYQKRGQIVDSRINRGFGFEIEDLSDCERIEQIAVRIQTV